MNMYSYLLVVFGLSFNHPRVLLIYISLVTLPKHNFFLHCSIWIARKKIFAECFIVLRKIIFFRCAVAEICTVYLNGATIITIICNWRNLELAILTWKMKAVMVTQQYGYGRIRTLSRRWKSQSLKICDIVCKRWWI